MYDKSDEFSILPHLVLKKKSPFNFNLLDGNASLIFNLKNIYLKLVVIFCLPKIGWSMYAECLRNLWDSPKYSKIPWGCVGVFLPMHVPQSQMDAAPDPPSLPWNRPFTSLPTGRAYLWSQRKMFLITSNIWGTSGEPIPGQGDAFLEKTHHLFDSFYFKETFVLLIFLSSW